MSERGNKRVGEEEKQREKRERGRQEGSIEDMEVSEGDAIPLSSLIACFDAYYSPVQ